ncbi:MAG: single-stranded-DNA-specific exonuclease RecJ, partial [Rhodoplanes sp.]
FLEEALAGPVEAARRDSALLVDAAVSAAAVTPEFCHMIARAGPYGAGNPEPILALPAHTLVYVEEVGQAHIRARLKANDGAAVEAIAFRAAGQALGRALMEHRGRSVHAAGCLALDRWQGVERVQFRLTDIASAEPVAVR